MENKFLGKNGIGELFQGMRKVKVQQDCVTPLKAGKENQLRQEPGPQPVGSRDCWFVSEWVESVHGGCTANQVLLFSLGRGLHVAQACCRLVLVLSHLLHADIVGTTILDCSFLFICL